MLVELEDLGYSIEVKGHDLIVSNSEGVEIARLPREMLAALPADVTRD